MSTGEGQAAAAAYEAEPYALYAIKFAHHVSRKSFIFLGGDANDGPMALDYFVWLAVGNGRKVLIDTGFKKAVGDRRGRAWIRCPSEAVELVGVSAAEITDVVVTHLHFDHAGNLDKFPNAIFHIQDRVSLPKIRQVERQLPKLHTRVRFPSPAPAFAAKAASARQASQFREGCPAEALAKAD